MGTARAPQSNFVGLSTVLYDTFRHTLKIWDDPLGHTIGFSLHHIFELLEVE